MRNSSKETRRRRKDDSPEAQENRLIALAMDATEERIRNGSATSQELVHFLRIAANREKERIERDILEEKKKLIVAKTRLIEASEREEQLYGEVLKKMREYQGYEVVDEDVDDEEDY